MAKMKKIEDLKDLSKEDLSEVVKLLMKELGLELYELPFPSLGNKFSVWKTEQKRASLKTRMRREKMVLDHIRGQKETPGPGQRRNLKNS